MALLTENKIIGCFDPVSRISHSVKANMIAEHSLMRVGSLISIGLNNRELADIRFIFFSVGCCCSKTAPMPVFDAPV